VHLTSFKEIFKISLKFKSKITFYFKLRIQNSNYLTKFGKLNKLITTIVLPTAHPHFPQSAIYKKAQEIFALSYNISQYFVHDFSALNDEGKEHEHIYFTGDIVQQSVSLAPQILKAEQHVFSEEKEKHIASVTRLANSLYRNCERLERSSSTGRDFLPILRKELKKFRKLQRSWMLTL
jgi:hypothetical protein